LGGGEGEIAEFDGRGHAVRWLCLQFHDCRLWDINDKRQGLGVPQLVKVQKTFES
jgi:hypothetical protein